MDIYSAYQWVDDWDDDSFGNLTKHYFSPITEKHYVCICTESRERLLKELRILVKYYDRPIDELMPQGGSTNLTELDD